MKNLPCIIFAFAISLFAGFGVHAQSNAGFAENVRFGANLEAAMPIGNMGNVYSFGIGGNVTGQYSLQDDIALTASLGYLSFSGKSLGSGSFKIPSFGVVPFRVGGKYYFTGGPFFTQAQLGMAFSTGKGGGSLFIYAPGVGVQFQQFEAALKYEAWTKNGTMSFMGVRVGYFF